MSIIDNSRLALFSAIFAFVNCMLYLPKFFSHTKTKQKLYYVSTVPSKESVFRSFVHPLDHPPSKIYNLGVKWCDLKTCHFSYEN